jgi:uncharacterized protein YecE (DUF72 family)
MKQSKALRVGISGWTYEPWRGVFFPKGLPHRRELEFASRQVNSIEINGTFYSLQRPKSYKTWYDATPKDFVFSLKGSRFITHLRRLKDVALPLANFFASGLLRLDEKLGPILWQLPPNFVYDADRLKSFFDLLPSTTHAAAKLARKHERMSNDRIWTEVEADRPMRHAMEVRHRSFERADFVELLRGHGIALVIADTAGKWPYMEDLTADFLYLRLHGDEELYASGYTDDALDIWARKIRTWAKGGNPRGAALHASPARSTKGRSVFIYFDNDMKVRSPADAIALGRRLKLPPPVPLD